MPNETVTIKFKKYLLENGLSQTEAARRIGYHNKHLSALLAGDDLSNNQRERMIKAFPDALFLIPDWARVAESGE